MKFIELTSKDDKVLLVNAEHIQYAVETSGRYTTVYFNNQDDVILVQERLLDITSKIIMSTIQ